MSKDKKMSDNDKMLSELFIAVAVCVVACMVLPLALIALPLAILLKSLLYGDKVLKKFGLGLLVGAVFYVFIFGVSDSFSGLIFRSFGDEAYLVFDELMDMKPKFFKFYPTYPEDIRLYFWLSYPVSVFMALAFKIKEKAKKKNSRELFKKKNSGGFTTFIRFLTVICIPYHFAGRLLTEVSGKIFSQKITAYAFFALMLSLFYIGVYLTFGSIFSWHIEFGYILNKADFIFKVVSPWFIDLFKQYFYLGAVLFPIVYLAKLDEFKINIVEGFGLREKVNKIGASGVYLGRNQDNRPIVLDNEILNHHVHVVGASGFGKTTFLLNIIKEKIEAHESVIFVDLKGDIDTVCEITTFAKNANRLDDFEFFSISEDFLDVSKGLSLFKNGNAVEIKDKIMGAFNYDHEYYKKRIESFLNLSLRALIYLRDKKDEEFDLESIYKLLLGFENIEDLSSKIDNEFIEKDLESLIADKKLKEDLTGLRADIEGLIKTDFGRLISKGGEINFYESMRDSKIVYIHLDSQRYEVSAEKLGRLILQDIKTASAKIVTTMSKYDRTPITLIVDEFANLATEQFVGFLNRARASGIGIVIAHQELSDLDVFSPVVKDQIMTNTSTLFSFLQKLPKSAEMISGIAGTYTTEKETTQFNESGGFFSYQEKTGMGSLREVEEYIIHPNLIKELERGECFMISKYPRTHIAKVFVNYLNYDHIDKDELMETLKELNGNSNQNIVKNTKKEYKQANYEDWFEGKI